MKNIFNFTNSYQKLGDEFFALTTPANTPNPQLLIKNKQLLKKLQLASIDNIALTNYLSGNKLTQDAIAMVYAGHQFGHFNPQLGDGRALLLGEIATPKHTYDIQLKGSGKTKYSRGGDGLLALGPAIREYLLSEYMFYAGINTSRCLALVQTSTDVLREKSLKGAVLTRVLQSNIRIGTFEYFAAREEWKHVKKLADYAISRHYPQIKNDEDKYLNFLQIVATNQANTVAQMMSIGFIHGVLNTDNTTISGEIIDYGPCAFMDTYKAHKVFSSIDNAGRYAYNNQANIIAWNLSSLGYCLSPFIANAKENIKQILTNYSHKFAENYNQIMANKLGFYYQSGDEKLIDAALNIAEKNNLDFTNFFRSLSSLENNYRLDNEFNQWFKFWKQRLTLETHNIKDLMNTTNPVFIPRNHVIEAIIQDGYKGELKSFYEFLNELKTPFTAKNSNQCYSKVPQPSEVVQATFCGT